MIEWIHIDLCLSFRSRTLGPFFQPSMVCVPVMKSSFYRRICISFLWLFKKSSICVRPRRLCRKKTGQMSCFLSCLNYSKGKQKVTAYWKRFLFMLYFTGSLQWKPQSGAYARSLSSRQHEPKKSPTHAVSPVESPAFCALKLLERDVYSMPRYLSHQWDTVCPDKLKEAACLGRARLKPL